MSTLDDAVWSVARELGNIAKALDEANEIELRKVATLEGDAKATIFAAVMEKKTGSSEQLASEALRAYNTLIP